MADIRSKMWTIVCYTDSMKSNAFDILDSQYLDLQFAISPLHDKDVTSDGELKKPHYHVIIKGDYRITQGKIYDICDVLGMQHYAEIVRNPKKMVEYLYHKNATNKANYLESDTIYLHDFEITDTDSITIELVHIVDNMKMCDFCQLVDFLVNYNMTTELGYVVKSQAFFNNYIKSRRFSHIDYFRQRTIDNESEFNLWHDMELSRYIDIVDKQYDEIEYIQDSLLDYIDLIG